MYRGAVSGSRGLIGFWLTMMRKVSVKSNSI